jgi:nucleoside-diphosphate-sugar epimerase
MTDRELKKALVVGASGVVGRRLAEYLHGLDDWEVVGLSRREPIGGSDVPRIAVDLTDAADSRKRLGGLSDVTHIFYEARFDHPEGQPEPIETNVAMFRNVVDTVVPIAPRLKHVHVGSGHKNYGLQLGPAPTPAREDTPRTLQPSFYYQQEDYIRALQTGKAWSWSTARPTGLCDTAPGITRSMISLICAYAAISKELGLPLRFPGTEGNYHALYQCTEALHLAKATVWMATEPKCANQDFNVTNGDTFRWANLWPKFADYFDMEVGPVQTVDLARHMADMEPVWQRVVEKHGLVRQPLDQVALWSYWKHLWTPHWDIVSSTTKARLYGFRDFVDSEEMFFRLFDHFRAERVFP